MFFKWDKITQKVKASSQDASMKRSNLQAGAGGEAEIYYEFKPLDPSKKAPHEPVSGKGPHLYPVPNDPIYKKLMERQLQFTAQDGKMVWQKMPKDMPMYYLSVGLVVLGLGLTLHKLKIFMSPPKND